VLVVLASALAPAAARASTAVANPEIIYTAEPGEANRVTVTPDGDRYVIEDPAAQISVFGDCEVLDAPAAHRVSCFQEDPRGPRVRLNLGDMDDVATGSPAFDSISGGPGNDQLYGAEGPDELLGGEGTDLLDGGGGDRVSHSDPGYAGAGLGLYVDELDGGPGADVLRGGDGDFDSVIYTSRRAPVSVTLDGLANDGEAGEGDLVGPGVENAYGGAGGDVLVGDGRPNALVGGDGDDLIDGGGGYGDSAIGGNGDDTILLSDGGEEAEHGIPGGVPGFAFDDLVRCDSYVQGAPNGDDTAFVDPTDVGQAGQVSPAEIPCEHVVMSNRPQALPVNEDGAIDVPLACGAGPQQALCTGVATVRLPKARGSARRAAPHPSGRLVAQRKFHMHLGRRRHARVRLNKAGRRAARGHKRLRVWVTYRYKR
jgi:Ca2+-binding RTX toxin-like protein